MHEVYQSLFGICSTIINITILPLPPKSPELKLVENIWRFYEGQRRLNPRLLDYSILQFWTASHSLRARIEHSS